MCLVAISLPAHAEVTAVSEIDNVVYIFPVVATSGSEIVLSVKMKNSVPMESFGFDLVLPEGISVATDEDGFVLAELSTERTTTKKTNHFDAQFRSDGSLNVQAYSSNGYTINGNDGEIALIAITIASTLAGGSYPIILKNIAMGDASATSYRTEYVETTITVTKVDDGRTVLDENSTTVPAAATNVDVRVKRTIHANEWSTIVLPFAMSEAQVKEVFGDDVQLGDFTGTDSDFDVDDNCVAIKANYDAVTAIEANHPYIIKVSQPVEEFTVDGVDINADEDEAYFEFDNGKSGSRRVVYSGFYGTYHAGTVLDKFTLFLNNNKFWYSMGQTKMKAFRAYFGFLDVLTEVENASNIKMWVNSDDATDIKAIDYSSAIDHNYNLAGQRVSKNYKGIVVNKNKKVLK